MRLIDADKLTPVCMFKGRCDSSGGSRCDRCADYSVEYQDIKNAPTVSPERKTGQWIPDTDSYYEKRFFCSVCRRSYRVDTCMGKPIWDFCPCGADMRSTERNSIV